VLLPGLIYLNCADKVKHAAFMSTTTRKEIAVSYIGDKRLPVLFECEVGDIDRGTSLSHVSQYPGEDEVLIPAMSYLEITGKSHVMETVIRHGSENKSVLVTVYPARINCNQKSQVTPLSQISFIL
jgi:hypothetical protein